MELDQNRISEAAKLLKHAKEICVLTGAGVSAESGIPTFRASDGLWEGHNIMDVATPEGWKRNPALVWQFYNARRANAGKVLPNPGHFALAMMEEKWGSQFTLTTQNVDGLHQVAGSKNVLELHGSLRRTRCTECGEIKNQGMAALPDMPECESCKSLLRPDIVWFHEMLPPGIWQKAEKAASRCDLFLVIGTSAVVYPAAGLIQTAQSTKPTAKVIEFNLTETDASAFADLSVFGPSGQTLNAVYELLKT